MAIILPEDACTFNRIAAFVKFCAKYVGDIKSRLCPVGPKCPISPTHPISPESRALRIFEVEKSMDQEIVQQSAVVCGPKRKGTTAQAGTLFERTLELSSQFGQLTADICFQSLRDGEERREPHVEAEPLSTSRSPIQCGIEQMQPLSGGVGLKRIATYFADDAFDGFCRDLMGTEIDGDDSSNVIALGRPPSEGSISMSESEEDEGDDLIVLDGPPPNVCFSLHRGMPQDHQPPIHCASPPTKRVKLTGSCDFLVAEDQQSSLGMQGNQDRGGATDREPNETPNEGAASLTVAHD